MIRICNSSRNCGRKAVPDRKGRWRLVSGGLPVRSRTVLFSIILLLAATSFHLSRGTVEAFCRNPTGTTNCPSNCIRQKSVSGGGPPMVVSSSSCVSSSTALGLFRPDWMRRAGRIEEKRKERRDMYEALRKRQDELGIPRALPSNKPKDEKVMKPQRYRVVSSSNNSNNTSYEDGLAIYPFVPENAVEANDESNVLDRLDTGEIVTAVRRKSVADASAEPPRMSVVAATAIYNVQLKIRTDILWIEHDRGGWSPCIVDGETRLIPVEEGNESQ